LSVKHPVIVRQQVLVTFLSDSRLLVFLHNSVSATAAQESLPSHSTHHKSLQRPATEAENFDYIHSLRDPAEEVIRRTGVGKVESGLQVQLEKDEDGSTRQRWVLMTGLWPMIHLEHKAVTHQHMFVL